VNPGPSRGVRVVAGRYRGLRLAVPDGRAVRPTGDRVREALFSILAGRIPGARVVDCFSGSGALGIEALSRGAREVFFIENAPRVRAVLESNLERLEDRSGARVCAADALRPRGWGVALPAEVILADPPYAGETASRFLAVLAAVRPLAEEGILVLEHDRQHEPDLGPWIRVDARHYGGTSLSFLALSGPDGS